jgi:glucose/arabinose dehydrogenase
MTAAIPMHACDHQAGWRSDASIPRTFVACVTKALLLGVLLWCCTLNAGAASFDLATEEVGTGFTKPIAVVAAPGVSNRLFVVEQHSGQIRILDPVSKTIAATPFVTVSGVTTGSEQGLLGLAFDPNYTTNGRFYVNCTRSGAAAGDSSGSGGGHTEILRYTANGSPTSPTTAGSETLVLAFNQPENNHNGGWIGFGPDGKFYIATGDGGGGGDAHGSIGNAQNRANLLGKILRIDLASLPYSIPSDNPYFGNGSGFRQEIWCWGLRNPWRCAFDRTTGDLWMGDVGQNAYEEVSVCPAGQKDLNYGWRVWEGAHRYQGSENLQGGYALSLIHI